MARGTCTVHAFNESQGDEGDPGMQRSVNVNSMLQPEPEAFSEAGY